MSSFTKSQSIAVRHQDGPLMVLAGPGSGKTTVVTRRVQYMVQEYGIPASSILVITFTKAAAAEMKERFLRLMKEEHTTVSFGTFHAVFFQYSEAGLWIYCGKYFKGRSALSVFKRGSGAAPAGDR